MPFLQRSVRLCHGALSSSVAHHVSTLTRHHQPIQMFPPNNPLSAVRRNNIIAAQCNYKHFSDRRCIIKSKNDSDDDEPEYLEIVTQTADRMRLAVRNYVDEHARSFHCNQSTNEINDEDEVKTSSKPPQIKLVGILATSNTHPISHEDCNSSSSDDDDSHGNEMYSEQIANICSVDGIAYEPWRVPPTRESIERAIQHANDRLDVAGILVFYPIENLDRGNNDKGGKGSARGPYKCQSTGVYYKSMDDYFRDMVSPEKDVEGYRRKGLRMKKPGDGHDNDAVFTAPEDLGPIYPCTALAVFRILESFQLSLNTQTESPERLFEGKTMTIINRSEVLGLPLATMLSNQGATVYSIDINSILQFMPEGDVRIRREHATKTMEQCVRESSVVITGVPSHSFRVPIAWISENATLINVATESNFEEEEVAELPGVTYVPHVGRVTVAALEYNLCLLHQNYHRDKTK
jgi:methylenetetrahydrofolate dehydrogenase (NAD+)